MLSEQTRNKLEAVYGKKLNEVHIDRTLLQGNRLALLQAGITEEELNLLEEYTRFSEIAQTIFVQMMKSMPIPFDKSLNAKYARFLQTMNELEEKGTLKQWFVQYVNNYLKPKERITLADVNSLKLIKESLHLKYLKRIYGNPYIRPFFMLNYEDFEKFITKLYGSRAVNYAGICLIGGGIEQEYFTSGLRIIVGRDENAMLHELRHSIDPYAHARKKENLILTECMAYFERNYDKGIEFVRSALKEQEYHAMCPHISFDEYAGVVDNVANILIGLRAYFTNEEIDRILYHCQTIDELKRVFLVVSIQGKI